MKKILFVCIMMLASRASAAGGHGQFSDKNSQIIKEVGSDNKYTEKKSRSSSSSRGIAGPKGATGATGAKGATGATGAQGAVGARGPQGVQGIAGAKGEKGDNGLTGDRGEAGAKGEKGDTGSVGPAGAPCFFLPYASGMPISLTSSEEGLAATGAVIGFGHSLAGITFVDANIDATNTDNFAFSLPRDGTITALSAHFSLVTDSISTYFNITRALSLEESTVTISAQVYTSDNNIFVPVEGGKVTLPVLTGELDVGTTFRGLASGLNIPVSAQTRVLVVFTASSEGASLMNTVLGHASAGLIIE